MSSIAWNGTEPSHATVSLGHLIFVMGVQWGRKECKRCTLRWKKIRQRGLHNATDCTEWFATTGGILCGNFSFESAVCGIFKLDKCYQPTGS
jgi:hypothetical protein